MAGSFPIGPPANYTHSIQIRAKITKFRSGKEQRCAVSGCINSFQFSWSKLNWAQTAQIRDFVITQKGAFDTTWSYTLLDPWSQEERPYENLALDSDEFSYTEQSIGRYDLTLACTQTVAEIPSVNPQATYPTIAGSVKVQLPFESGLRYSTDRTEVESGKRFTYFAWGAPLRSWNLKYPLITDNEVETLVAFYYKQGGPVHGFSFADPNTGATYSACRYSESPLQITRICPNNNSVSVGIEQYLA